MNKQKFSAAELKQYTFNIPKLNIFLTSKILPNKHHLWENQLTREQETSVYQLKLKRVILLRSYKCCPVFNERSNKTYQFNSKNFFFVHLLFANLTLDFSFSSDGNIFVNSITRF